MISLTEGLDRQRPIHDRDKRESMPEGHAMQSKGRANEGSLRVARSTLMPLAVILQAELNDALDELIISNVDALGGFGEILAE